MALSTFNITWMFMMRISQFLVPIGYGYLRAFLFQHHLGLYTMHDPTYLGKTTLLFVKFRKTLTQIINWVHKDSHQISNFH